MTAAGAVEVAVVAAGPVVVADATVVMVAVRGEAW